MRAVSNHGRARLESDRRRSPKRTKVISPEEAARAVVDGDTLAVGGFVGIAVPEELLIALAKRFDESGRPRDLTLVFAAGQGDGGARGLNHLAREGLVRRAIGAHWGFAPRLGALALDDRIEAYCIPQGVVSHLYRETAAGRPGLITRVGLGTFVDPRVQGGRMNAVSTEEVVRSTDTRGRGVPVLPLPVRSMWRSCAARPPTRTAT